MKTHPFGDTGIQVTRFGLGLAALGRPGYINLDHADDLNKDYQVDAMRDNTHAVLDAAYDAGIRYFDAARSYGKAEQFLASWLNQRGLQPNDVVIGSKWGYTYTADWHINTEQHEIKDHSLDVFKRQWQETQAILGQYVNLYQIHSATLETGVLANTDVLNELARLKADGIKIGLSVSGGDQAAIIGRAINVHIDGERLFDSVQATWNVLEQSASDALYAAHLAGMGVIVKEALANGRLTQKNTDTDFILKLASLHVESNRLETTIDALALAAVLSLDWVDIVLSGAANCEHLTSNLKAADVPWDQMAAITLARLAESPEAYWQTRSQLKWN